MGLLISITPVHGQNPVGQLEATNYTKLQYAAGAQNWAMAQDENGRLYVANNEGLLIYNGSNWQVFPVPNKTILRSIAFGPQGRLYAGAQDELGYFAPDGAGRLIYTSLKNLLPPADNSFADIWDIEVVNNEVFFRANDKIFRLFNNRLQAYRPATNWIAMFKYNGRLAAQDEREGLLVFEQGQWQPLITAALLPRGFYVTDIIPYAKDTSLVSAKSGLYLLAGNQLLPFSLKNMAGPQYFTSLAVLDENSFLAGTYSNGIYHISCKGNVLSNISAKSALQNNTVRCIYADAGGNVWTGLDNGISFIPFSGAIKHINPPAFNNGAGYGVTAYNGSLYFALSTGLMRLPVTTAFDLGAITAEPEMILSGLTWNVSATGNHLLAGRDDGLWKVSGNTAAPVSSVSGFWASHTISPSAPPEKIAAGYYTGIRLFSHNNGGFTDEGAVKNFTESSRYIETDGDNIWVSHPYRGVFRITAAGNTVTKYTVKDGLPGSLDNHVFKIKNQIVFATPRGIYEYRAETGKIVPAVKYAPLFGQMPLRYLKEDEKGNIWFVKDKMPGVADFSGPAPVIHFIPELDNRILSGFENVYPYNTQNVLVGGGGGFYHINYDKYRQSLRPFKAYITLLKMTGGADSILYGGYGVNAAEKMEKVTIPHKRNALHFSFSASLYNRQPYTEFSYYLEGFDGTWSHWGAAHEKEYTNLPEGSYTFHVKARTSPSHESAECVYTFTVLPPWYRTWWAYAMYALGALALLYALYRFQEKKHFKKQEARRLADQKKFEEEQRQLAYQHQLELEKTEKELIRLKNENLEAEIEHKNAELASTAMNLVQKKEFLLKITEELNKLNKQGRDTIEATELKRMLRSLSSEEKLDEEWKQFSMHFNNVHSNFLITLKNKFPGLTAHELKLCAYLRMNLTSKEMAQLMSISVRGVEINRYRLRKKLQLQPKEDLFQFLLNVEGINNGGGGAAGNN